MDNPSSLVVSEIFANEINIMLQLRCSHSLIVSEVIFQREELNWNAPIFPMNGKLN